MWRSVQRWRGVVLMSSIAAVIVWLAITGQLGLYIHPRYYVFTVSMIVIALVLAIAAIATRRRHDDESAAPPSRSERVLGLTAAGIAAVFALGMVVVPPATLSTATADQREINSTAATDSQAFEEASQADNDAVARFTVREWSTILRQTSDLAFFRDKPVTELVGFVTPDPDDPENTFYLSRFVVTCCAVDAQPLGVPVHMPGWADSFAIDSWVTIAGEFGSNPSSSSLQPVALIPDSVDQIEQPREPYLF